MVGVSVGWVTHSFDYYLALFLYRTKKTEIEIESQRKIQRQTNREGQAELEMDKERQ